MDDYRPTPVELYEARRFKIIRASLWFLVFLIATFVYWRYFAETPEDYTSDIDHFKYGSIGSDTAYGGIPYLAWRVMPQVCSEHLPDPDAFKQLPPNEQVGLAGYRQFGFLVEDGRDRPIGFSKRQAGLELVGLNCAVCHTSTVRTGDGMDSEKIYSLPDSFLYTK